MVEISDRQALRAVLKGTLADLQVQENTIRNSPNMLTDTDPLTWRWADGKLCLTDILLARAHCLHALAVLSKE